jgi:hypothetical protein
MLTSEIKKQFSKNPVQGTHLPTYDLCVDGRRVKIVVAVFLSVAPCSLVKFTDVSEVLAASIIRAIMRALLALMMEAASTPET